MNQQPFKYALYQELHFCLIEPLMLSDHLEQLKYRLTRFILPDFLSVQTLCCHLLFQLSLFFFLSVNLNDLNKNWASPRHVAILHTACTSRIFFSLSVCYFFGPSVLHLKYISLLVYQTPPQSHLQGVCVCVCVLVSACLCVRKR